MSSEKTYRKNSPRLSIKFIDAETNNQLFEIPNKTWMEVGEFFSDKYVNDVIKGAIKQNNLPSNVIVMVAGVFSLK